MSDLAPVAHGYNKPDRDTDLEASFLDLGTAQAYVNAYGGTIEGRGVGFAVRDADHAKAKDDLAESQRQASLPAPTVVSDVDDRIARAVAAASAQLRREFEEDRAAFEAERAAFLDKAETATANPSFTAPADQAPAV